MSSTIEQCMTSHGLTPETVTAKTTDGKLLTIPFSDAPATTSTIGQSADTTITRATALYLLDRFAVSDQFYHELAQVCASQ
jgi:hypothetical protein